MIDPFGPPYRDEVQFLVIVVLAIAAWHRGGAPERACAGTLMAMMMVDRLWHAVFGPTGDLGTFDWWHGALDLGLLVAFVAIGLRANRFYPMVMAGFQLVSVNAHIVRIGVEDMAPIAYGLLYIVPSYFQIFALAVGLALHIRRKRMYGPYRDWRPAASTG